MTKIALPNPFLSVSSLPDRNHRPGTLAVAVQEIPRRPSFFDNTRRFVLDEDAFMAAIEPRT